MDSRVSFRRLVFLSLSLVGLSLIICISSGLYNDFKRVTYTSCGSYEVLPSISAAVDINGYHRALWQVPVLLHCLEHGLMTFLSYRFYQTPSVRVSIRTVQSYSPLSGVLNIITTLVDLTGVISLFLLSIFTSTLNFPVHKKSVITFMLSTAIHMFLATYQLWRQVNKLRSAWDAQPLHKNQSHQLLVRKSLQMKLCCVLVNTLAISLGSYVYLHHSAHCKAYTYSVFALCEYTVVAVALLFHYSLVWDLPRTYLSLTFAEPDT